MPVDCFLVAFRQLRLNNRRFLLWLTPIVPPMARISIPSRELLSMLFERWIFATPKGLKGASTVLAVIGNSISVTENVIRMSTVSGIASLDLQMGKIAALAQKTKLCQLLKNQIR